MSKDFIQKHDPDFEKALEHLKQELQALRTGRATPAVVEPIIVDAYGAPTPLVQLASISSPEPSQLFIQPWDANLLKNIEKAIQTSSLGLMPIIQGNGLRLNFPPLTEERRKELVKALHEKLESAKISIRGIRELIQKSIKQAERKGEISEDEADMELKALQEKVEIFNGKIQEVGQAKEKDLTTI
ncbi:ribosome recycling factor [Candidatus Parcubacteria bacterium]|jgi:ribosome recycling factor|nr:MAG: ribosome recycling factor [Candidatus Parcubacteria bacterium]